MNYADFISSIENISPSGQISVYLKALWLDAKEDWSGAHHLIDDMEDANAYWVHAYLHRKEGDNSNANYWYRKAGKPMPSFSLEQEWENIVKALL